MALALSAPPDPALPLWALVASAPTLAGPQLCSECLLVPRLNSWHLPTSPASSVGPRILTWRGCLCHEPVALQLPATATAKARARVYRSPSLAGSRHPVSCLRRLSQGLDLTSVTLLPIVHPGRKPRRSFRPCLGPRLALLSSRQRQCHVCPALPSSLTPSSPHSHLQQPLKHLLYVGDDCGCPREQDAKQLLPPRASTAAARSRNRRVRRHWGQAPGQHRTGEGPAAVDQGTGPGGAGQGQSGGLA